MYVIVEISARHLHLSQEHLDILYGAGYKLTPKKDLSQPGQFACAEKVEVIGPKGSMKMSILGPVRPATQVEISLTDARTLGIKVPVRESGVVAGSGSCKLVARAFFLSGAARTGLIYKKIEFFYHPTVVYFCNLYVRGKAVKAAAFL